jgi:predicted alpha/beta superfamily hydrolase
VAHLLPTAEAGPPSGAVDWWVGALPVPPAGSEELNLAFTDGDGAWENDHGADYACPVLGGPGEPRETPVHRPRSIAKRETHELAGGTLHIVTLGLREGADAQTAEARAARWQEEKTLRVWTPPCWRPGVAPPGGYCTLYISDANNLFEDWLAHQGVCWRAAETAAGLIERGDLPPFIIVGIDAVGAFRSLNYLPFPPGSGVGGFRPDCARWPGGKVDDYLARVAADILPLAEREFGASAARERRVFGGSSFGGVAALHAAMTQGETYAGFLCESPSLWVGEGRYLGLMEAPWPRPPAPDVRIFLGSGTREYSATRDEPNEQLDGLLADYHARAARILETQGVRDGRLRFLCEEGAGHHEGAWGWRLGGALLHLLHGR